ncbi:MAG: hypothetical protein ABIS86_17040 [Streptosporangiaceae bacterium]
MSMRRLWVLIQGLPRDSAVAHIATGAAADWGVPELLLARVGNLLIQANAETVNEKDLLKPPDPISTLGG